MLMLDVLRLSIGPLNGDRFRFANTMFRPGDAGGGPRSLPLELLRLRLRIPNAAPPSLNGALTTLIFVGKEDEVGVAGSTFTLECGDLETLCPETETAGD